MLCYNIKTCNTVGDIETGGRLAVGEAVVCSGEVYGCTEGVWQYQSG